MRKRPCSNFREISRAKSERTEGMGDDNTLTLYWLKQGAGKFTPATPPSAGFACSILPFTSFIARDRRLPAYSHYGFSLSSDTSKVRAHRGRLAAALRHWRSDQEHCR